MFPGDSSKQHDAAVGTGHRVRPAFPGYPRLGWCAAPDLLKVGVCGARCSGLLGGPAGRPSPPGTRPSSPPSRPARSQLLTPAADWRAVRAAGGCGPPDHMPAQISGALVYLVTAWRLGRYYRTYAGDEVKAALDDTGRQFQRGPITLRTPGAVTGDTPAFVVQDRNYLSAHWAFRWLAGTCPSCRVAAGQGDARRGCRRKGRTRSGDRSPTGRGRAARHLSHGSR